MTQDAQSVTHYPSGPWFQPDGSYAGSCSCGQSFHAPTLPEAKLAWIEHFLASQPASAGDAVALKDPLVVHVNMLRGSIGAEARQSMTDDQIKYMAGRFLSWKLPKNFNPDGGTTAMKNVIAFADALDSGDFSNVKFELSQQMCCNGQMCGCQGATVGQYLAHELRAALTPVQE